MFLNISGALAIIGINKIHEELTSFYGSKTTTKESEWPGGLLYKLNVIQVWFRDTQLEL